ncbi:hypothetical protein KGF56_002706 [Candida oxycetoniae]|uniref:5-hydroxyisourate hydrolase n=1 Tax=Candida oxycetoniae TaxID=497107 RepID=A0AAI9WXX1_9ASCO|nr:uncharacterized protein KGF56_002706 [Candida oxycetoniae]KAI3404514.1 hypothetical protein KGF56_002706 [Candida oxycetoniae]
MPDPITCHVLDTNRGKPAESVIAQLYNISSTTNHENVKPFALSKTNSDGRITTWSFDPDVDYESTGVVNNKWEKLVPGQYKIKFLTSKYFKAIGGETFFPFVEIAFEVTNNSEHYHIPLLLSNFSYTTYRGS